MRSGKEQRKTAKRVSRKKLSKKRMSKKRMSKKRMKKRMTSKRKQSQRVTKKTKRRSIMRKKKSIKRRQRGGNLFFRELLRRDESKNDKLSVNDILVVRATNTHYTSDGTDTDTEMPTGTRVRVQSREGMVVEGFKRNFIGLNDHKILFDGAEEAEDVKLRELNWEVDRGYNIIIIYRYKNDPHSAKITHYVIREVDIDTIKAQLEKTMKAEKMEQELRLDVRRPGLEEVAEMEKDIQHKDGVLNTFISKLREGGRVTYPAKKRKKYKLDSDLEKFSQPEEIFPATLGDRKWQSDEKSENYEAGARAAGGGAGVDAAAASAHVSASTADRDGAAPKEADADGPEESEPALRQLLQLGQLADDDSGEWVKLPEGMEAKPFSRMSDSWGKGQFRNYPVRGSREWFKMAHEIEAKMAEEDAKRRDESLKRTQRQRPLPDLVRVISGLGL